MVDQKHRGHPREVSSTVFMDGGDNVLTNPRRDVHAKTGQGAFHGVCKPSSVDEVPKAPLGFNHVRQGDLLCRPTGVKSLCNDSAETTLSICRPGDEEQLVFVVEGHEPSG